MFRLFYTLLFHQNVVFDMLDAWQRKHCQLTEFVNISKQQIARFVERFVDREFNVIIKTFCEQIHYF